jgi:hypothetical protein
LVEQFFPSSRLRFDIFTGREMGADGPPPPLLDSQMASNSSSWDKDDDE